MQEELNGCLGQILPKLMGLDSWAISKTWKEVGKMAHCQHTQQASGGQQDPMSTASHTPEGNVQDGGRVCQAVAV